MTNSFSRGREQETDVFVYRRNKNGQEMWATVKEQMLNNGLGIQEEDKNGDWTLENRN